MFLSKKVSDDLYETYKNNDNLIITACNGMGQEFTTIGKIATIQGRELPEATDNLEADFAGILQNCIFVEFAAKPDQYRSDYCSIFYTDLEYCEVNLLFIKEIKHRRTGKTLFVNKDYEEYYKLGRANITEYGKLMLAKKITPAMFNGIGAELNNYIGHPINIYNQKGIITFIDNASQGNISVFYSNFVHVSCIEIPKSSIIEIQKNGVIKVSKNNNKYPTFEDFLYGKK